MWVCGGFSQKQTKAVATKQRGFPIVTGALAGVLEEGLSMNVKPNAQK